MHDSAHLHHSMAVRVSHTVRGCNDRGNADAGAQVCTVKTQSGGRGPPRIKVQHEIWTSSNFQHSGALRLAKPLGHCNFRTTVANRAAPLRLKRTEAEAPRLGTAQHMNRMLAGQSLHNLGWKGIRVLTHAHGNIQAHTRAHPRRRARTRTHAHANGVRVGSRRSQHGRADARILLQSGPASTWRLKAAVTSVWASSKASAASWVASWISCDLAASSPARAQLR